ncbi:MAG TPA: hypothetical protein P5550_09045, partial [Bacteroidales bacterium]|nr:hypothetical protein [Bacteroidales bacterium]
GTMGEVRTALGLAAVRRGEGAPSLLRYASHRLTKVSGPALPTELHDPHYLPEQDLDLLHLAVKNTLF